MTNLRGPPPVWNYPCAMASRIRQPVLSRGFAAAWWVFMVLFGLIIVATWIQAAVHLTLGRTIAALAITLVVGIPLRHELPNTRRMAKMLATGT